jgi:hypothetical protein
MTLFGFSGVNELYVMSSPCMNLTQSIQAIFPPMIARTGYYIGWQASAMGIFILATLHLSQACAGGPIYEEGLTAYSNGDIAAALQVWKPLAEHGDAQAQFAVASLYYDGIGVPVDHTESSYWFHLAAEQGHAEAQYNLGNAYKRGEGVRQSDAMAIHWWKKAAEQGLAEAQSNLALAWQEGDSVIKDDQTASRFYRQAAKNGHPADSAMIADPGRPAQSKSEADCESWLDSQSPNAYTLQLMSSTRPDDDYELARQHGMSGYVVCSYPHAGNTRHALLIGTYSSIDAASTAVMELPPDLKTGMPWVRKISDIERAVTGNAP